MVHTALSATLRYRHDSRTHGSVHRETGPGVAMDEAAPQAAGG
jgi:hypothetical protein